MNSKMEDRTCKTCRHNDDLLCARKESGSEMTIAAVNGKRNHGSSGEKA